MITVTEAEAAAIRAAFEAGGEFAAAAELRWLYPGLLDNEHTRAAARAIVGWWPPVPTPAEPPASHM